MTQQEFSERTKIVLSSESFEKMHEDYCNSPWNKDKYCQLWCEVNAAIIEDIGSGDEVLEEVTWWHLAWKELEAIHSWMFNASNSALKCVGIDIRMFKKLGV